MKKTDKPEEESNLPAIDSGLNLPQVAKEKQDGLINFIQENSDKIGGIVGDTMKDIFSGKVKGPRDIFKQVFGKLDELEKSKNALNSNNSSQNQLPEHGKDND